MIVLAVVFVVVSTWTQVTSPELSGQATDCFLVPCWRKCIRCNSPPQLTTDQKATTGCWLGTTEDPSTLSFSDQIIYKAYHLADTQCPIPSTPPTTERIAGLFRLILIIIALYVLGAVLTGATFFAMAWTGQHVLRSLRVEVFEKLHSLSLSYYAEHEAGDLMSRITNDTSAIEQAFSFALVNVFSGISSAGVGRIQHADR